VASERNLGIEASGWRGTKSIPLAAAGMQVFISAVRDSKGFIGIHREAGTQP
jgi:hypothetical protein